MNAKAGFSCALVLAVLSTCAVRGEETPKIQKSEVSQVSASASSETLPAPEVLAPGGISSWMSYTRSDCCGPFGGNGPINSELYIHTGPSVPAGSTTLARLLGLGWDFQGGGRSLFFNPDLTAAWTADFGINYIYNHGINQNIPVVLNIPAPTTLTLNDLHRTFANLSCGREWYQQPANMPGCKWRYGFDVGGRLGTAKIEFNEIRHRTDTLYGVLAAGHTDLEIPCGCCTFLVGARMEWDYTWTTILQNRGDNIQDVNLLLTGGVRF